MAIYQKKDKQGKVIKDNKGNSWYYRCYYTDVYGNRKQRQSKMYATKSEAVEEERRFLNKTYEDKEKTCNMTFKELYNSYYDFNKDKIKETTLLNYPVHFKALEPLHNIKLKDFTFNKFEMWKDWANKKNWSTIYKNTCYCFLRAMLNYAVKYLDFNSFTPLLYKMTNFNNPSEPIKEMKFYTYEEYQDFISYEDDLMWHTIFDILYFVGLRKGELRGLQWKNIDLENGTITIDHQIPSTYRKIDYKITPPKTKTSYRTLPLNKLVKEELQELYKEYSKYIDFNQDWFVFGGILPLDRGGIAREKNKIYNKSGITKKIRVHDWRHSCASFLINNGADITLVSKYLGHATIQHTLKTYTHLYKNRLDDIIKLIDDKIEENDKK